MPAPFHGGAAHAAQPCSEPSGTTLARALRLKLSSYGNTGRRTRRDGSRLTDKQKQYAGLERKVMVVGNLDRIEVWDPERYQQHLGKPDAMNMAMGDLASMFLRGTFPETRER